MREIKFRGKSIDNGGWVYGYIVKTFTGRCFILIGNDECFKENIWSINPKHEEFITSEFYEVDERTVGQYTGFKDKNGQEIYEGDIVKYEEEMDKSVAIGIGVVEYDDLEALYHIGHYPIQHYIYDTATDNPKVFVKVVRSVHD